MVSLSSTSWHIIHCGSQHAVCHSIASILHSTSAFLWIWDPSFTYQNEAEKKNNLKVPSLDLSVFWSTMNFRFKCSLSELKNELNFSFLFEPSRDSENSEM